MYTGRNGQLQFVLSMSVVSVLVVLMLAQLMSARLMPALLMTTVQVMSVYLTLIIPLYANSVDVGNVD